MIDISKKKTTHRLASACVEVRCSGRLLEKIKRGRLAKGDCLAVAQVAGILAAKNTASLVPLCHPVRLTHAALDFKFLPGVLIITSVVKAKDSTGVEMEALAACCAAALAVYDMAKAQEPGIVISGLKLLRKTGGKSDYKIR